VPDWGRPDVRIDRAGIRKGPGLRSAPVITDDSGESLDASLDEPLEAIPVDTGTGSRFGSVFAWVAVAIVVVVVGGWVWTRWINPPVGGTIDRYAHDGGGVVFENPADEFRAMYPTKWRRTTEPNELGTVVTVSDDPGGGYAFSVTKTPEPETLLENYKSALNQLAGQLASAEGAELIDQAGPVPLHDVALTNVVYRKGGTYWRVRLILLQDRLYTIVVKAPNNDPAPYQRLTTTFQILGPR
jgi:hypothetical protein